MAIVNAIGSICHAIISGVVTVIDVLISCLTCGYCGKRKRRGGRSAV
jgi:threonine dehydrogenase-like Zn-dependent dehydrogenase